ncbi:hypothetical protein HDU97_006528 [Phlyctochytrium planicorne]|nr:hypothetical protein HDU97_006528 [Phlyctochytrium planicorne]
MLPSMIVSVAASIILLQSNRVTMGAAVPTNLGTSNPAHRVAARANGPIIIKTTALKIIPVMKDVGVSDICGNWLTRNDNGTAASNQARCMADSECLRPGRSSIGSCVKATYPVLNVTVPAPDGFTCGYDLKALNKPEFEHAASLVVKSCPAGKSCKFFDGDALNGFCVSVPGEAVPVPPIPKEEIVVPRLGETCGTILATDADGKTPKFSRAKCTSGLQCSLKNLLTGTCKPYNRAAPVGALNDGVCGYIDGTVYACTTGNCIFPDERSLLGYCPDGPWVAPVTTDGPSGNVTAANGTATNATDPNGAPSNTDTNSTIPFFPSTSPTWSPPEPTPSNPNPTTPEFPSPLPSNNATMSEPAPDNGENPEPPVEITPTNEPDPNNGLVPKKPKPGKPSRDFPSEAQPEIPPEPTSDPVPTD